MAQPFIDTFDGAGATTNLGDWTPTGGTAWTYQAGSTSSIQVYTSGAARCRNTTASYFTCDDQGSADQYVVIQSLSLSTALPNAFAACRLVDTNNYLAWRVTDTGSTGRRLTKRVSGTLTDLVTSQGVANEWIKVEVSGTTAKLYEGGTGGSPGTWNQVGSDQTYSENTTETGQGIRNSSNSSTTDWLGYFEAGALGSGGQTISATQATETDAAQTITVTTGAISVAVGATASTESAQTITPALVLTVAVGQASETDAAQAITPVVSGATAVGHALETDAAQAITPVPGAVTVAIAAATETESAQAISALNGITVSLGAATELGTVGAITPVPGGIIVSFNPATESGTAQIITVSQPGDVTLTPDDLLAIAEAVWADATAVAAHAKLDTIIARLTC